MSLSHQIGTYRMFLLRLTLFLQDQHFKGIVPTSEQMLKLNECVSQIEDTCIQGKSFQSLILQVLKTEQSDAVTMTSLWLKISRGFPQDRRLLFYVCLQIFCNLHIDYYLGFFEQDKKQKLKDLYETIFEKVGGA